MELILNSYSQQRCSLCGANLNVGDAPSTIVCEYCGASYAMHGQPAPKAAKVQPDPDAFEIRSGLLVKYTGSAAEVEIPGGVKEIGENAFADALLLEQIIMPDGVTKIRKNAFMNCPSLAYVKIPASVEEIDRTAFTLSDAGNSEGTKDSPALVDVEMSEEQWLQFYKLFPYTEEGNRLIQRYRDNLCLRCGDKISDKFKTAGMCLQCGVKKGYNRLCCYYCGEKLKFGSSNCLKCGRTLTIK